VGGNQFTPLLIAYREHFGYSTTSVKLLLGAYVLGLVPGLLVAPAISNQYGRRPVLLAGVVSSAGGSLALASADWGGQVLIVTGRVLSGLAVGVAMSVGTAWMNELSSGRLDPGADAGSGPRRSSISPTVGFMLGPGAAGLIAQWSPLPLVTPYLLHVAIAVPAAVMLARHGLETRSGEGAVRLRERLRVPGLSYRRFRWVVMPTAPWIFGSAGIAYAIVPQQVDAALGSWALLFATGADDPGHRPGRATARQTP
jgi:MFS family permease